MGTAAICAGAMALIGISHYSGAEDPKPAPVFISMPASAPSASICEVRCPGYEEPDDSYHPAPAFLYEKPTIPTNGVVTVYVAAPVSAAQATKASKASPKVSKASSAKASSSKASGTSKATTPKATAPKQTVPSTTVTTKTSVSTHSTAKGSTTTNSTSTSTTHKG